MRASSKETIEHRKCPPEVAKQLLLAGGENRFGEPMFRVVWGYDRIVPIHGEWQEWETLVGTLTDKVTGVTDSRKFIQLKSSVIETREVPKYLPANCWHLEMWRPPEEYGSPEAWGKAGEEVVGLQTIDTAGPYPSRGEYELCYPLTHDSTSGGKPLPLIGVVVEEVVRMIIVGRERFNLQQRRAAIEQEAAKKEDGFVRVTRDMLKDGCRPFAGEPFITVPQIIKP